MIERFILLRPSPGHVTQVFINIYRKSTEISNQSLKIAQTENLVTYQIFFSFSSTNGNFDRDEKFDSVEDFSVCRCKRFHLQILKLMTILNKVYHESDE